MDVTEATHEATEMNEFMNSVTGNGVDMMDMMKLTHQEVSIVTPTDANDDDDARPSLLTQDSTLIRAVKNDFTGQPLLLDETAIPEDHEEDDAKASPNIKDVTTINLAPAVVPVENEITINIGKPKHTLPVDITESYLDDDLDDLEEYEQYSDYDAKDDLTKDQQKQEDKVNLARYVAHQMDHLADDVLNVDELEQQHRMRKDPDNPHNIFVLKFGKNEEQHWRLPWNATTNLLCAMEPNRLLIEQSKYNAMYVKYSLTPQEFKKAMIKAQTAKIQQTNKEKREAKKKYKMKVETSSGSNKNKLKEPMKLTLIDTASGGTMSVPMLAPGNSGLLGVANNKPAQRGTFMQHSMMVHSENTVDHALPTDLTQLIKKQSEEKHNALLMPQTQHVHVMTPITAQIRPELMKLAMKQKPKDKDDEKGDEDKPRRVSLVNLDEEEETMLTPGPDLKLDFMASSAASSSSNSSASSGANSSDEYHGKSSKINVSVDLPLQAVNSDTVELLGADGGVVKRWPAESVDMDAVRKDMNKPKNVDTERSDSGGKFDISPAGADGDDGLWHPPGIFLETWMAVDIWKDLLYLGDEWDALNYTEIMDHSIEYFINCAAGYCAFDYEQKLKEFWLQNWKENRAQEAYKRKEKQKNEREKRREARLAKFKRMHPDWIPPGDGDSGVDLQDDEEKEPVPKEKKRVVDLNKVSIEDFAFFVNAQSPKQETPNKARKSRYPKRKVRFRKGKDNDSRAELELFAERKEFEIIESLHNKVLALEVDDSSHSSMYDSCISSDAYQYDSEEYDEYLGMKDEQIIEELCPFKFLNIHAHNWEGYRLLDLHMNDVWNFIEECRMKNVNLQQKKRRRKKKIGCLVFCTNNTIPMSRLRSEFESDPNYTKAQLGVSICNILRNYRIKQEEVELEIWNAQVRLYNEYMERINADKAKKKTRAQIKAELVRAREGELYKSSKPHMFAYKYWKVNDQRFWEDFEFLKTRDNSLNRLFASSHDRSAALVLGFILHSANGIKLEPTLKGLQRNKPNTLRNQSFLRQLIQLDWMKRMFNKAGMREQVRFRDEYKCYELDHYLKLQKHYNLK
eukprot:1142446_1